MTEFDDILTIHDDGSAVRADLGDGWAVFGNVNGGVLMALALASARGPLEHAGAGAHTDPISWSSSFLSAGRAGPVTITHEVLRVGRSMSTAQVSLLQEDQGRVVERVRTLATFADLSELSDPVHRAQEPPQMPGPDHCLSVADFVPDELAVMHRIDLRLDPETAGFGVGEPSMAGEIRGWVRFADGCPTDVLSLPFFVDAFPPVALDLGAVGWAPTISFAGHIRRRPAPGWLRVRLTTTNVAGGLFEEDCVIWDETDAVVAQSRQIAGLRFPETPGD
ncbi:MAG: thioesterase family protein [Phycicoccus sp.]|nr:thioesterase family protein [Phycicoccus sp.]